MRHRETGQEAKSALTEGGRDARENGPVSESKRERERERKRKQRWSGEEREGRR